MSKKRELSANDRERIFGDGTHKGLEVSPNITSEEDYLQAVSVGEKRARVVAGYLCAVNPALTELAVRLINDEYTRDIFPKWSNEFRAPGLVKAEVEDAKVWFQVPPVGPFDMRVFDAIDWQKVPEAMQKLGTQLATDLENASPEEKWTALVNYSVDLVQIQPFLDGNRRLARVIFEAQVRAVFGFEGDVAFPENYNDLIANAAANRATDMATEQVEERDTRMDRLRLKRELERVNPELYERIRDWEVDYTMTNGTEPGKAPPTTKHDPTPPAKEPNPSPTQDQEGEIEKAVKDFKAPRGALAEKIDPEKRKEVDKLTGAANETIKKREQELKQDRSKDKDPDKDPEPSQ